jgi:hypothetical protein
MALRWWTLVAWLAVSPIATASDALVFAPRDGVLVLRNGRTLHGRITPLGESYLVTIGDGGEVCIPRTEVDFDCGSLEEGYLIKRDWLESDDAAAHLALANWCLQHGLLARAADQLLVASMQAPDHPRLKLLERQLAARVSPPSQHKVVSYTPAVTPAPADAPDIEPFLVQQFTTTVQTILFNRCASFACHGGGSSAYRLIRPGSGQVATSRLTQRNLQATLAYIDRSQPESSRLLTMAQQPHGRVATAIFHEKTGNQLALLTGWVRRLGKSFPEPAAQSPEPAPPADRQTVRIPPVGAEDEVAMPPSAAARNRAAQPAPGNPVRRTSSGSEDPADPFDPAVFNRRSHARP